MANNARYEPFWPTGRRSGPYGDPVFERFDRMLQDAFGVTLAPTAGDRPAGAVNLYDTAEGYWLELPLPGVPADGVDLSVQQNLLTLKARREWAPPEGAQVIWQGFGAGQWQQTFALPGEVDAERVEARLADGRRAPVPGAPGVVRAGGRGLRTRCRWRRRRRRPRRER